MPQARLAALHTLLAGLIARPEPGALVVACVDFEVFYLLHTLATLDCDSPADRFLTVAADYTDLPTYIAHIYASIPGEPAPDIADPAHAASHLHGLFTRLLADLPPGDHHLAIALIPPQIADPTGFAALTHPLLATPHDPRLRLIIRDDPRAPHSFDFAATCPSEHVFAYRFSLPPELFVRELHATVDDPRRPPDERALAHLQLAGQDLGHQRTADALTRCDLAASLATTNTLRTTALAFKADTLRRHGDKAPRC